VAQETIRNIQETHEDVEPDFLKIKYEGSLINNYGALKLKKENMINPPPDIDKNDEPSFSPNEEYLMERAEDIQIDKSFSQQYALYGAQEHTRYQFTATIWHGDHDDRTHNKQIYHVQFTSKIKALPTPAQSTLT